MCLADDDSIAYTGADLMGMTVDAPMCNHLWVDSLIVDAHKIRAGAASMALTEVAPRAHVCAISMALVMDSLMDLAETGPTAFKSDAPTTRAEAFSAATVLAVDASIAYAGADSMALVVR